MIEYIHTKRRLFMSEKGILYVMSTAVKGLIKIGKTKSFKTRMRQLEHTGYCNVTALKREFAIEVKDYEAKEKLLEDLFASCRPGNSELYSVNLQYVIQLLSSFEGKLIYPQDTTKEKMFESAKEIVESSCLPNGTYFLNAKSNGKIVKGKLKVSDGQLTLLKGSILSSSFNIQVKRYSDARKKARKNGNLLMKNVPCDSVSMAAAIVCGSNQNGWDKWKNEQGQKINIYRQRNEGE